MDSADYIKERVAGLGDHAHEIYNVADGVSNDFDSWTALKLILHSAAINMYSKVHRNQGTGDIFYIDALAGCGISTYDSDRFFIGSSLLAARETVKPFSKMYFIESEGEYCDALRDRLDYAFSLPQYTEPDDFKIIEGDANERISEVVDEIRDLGSYEDRFNYYCFADNQGLDFTWSSIEELTPKPYGDLLINLPIAHAIGRTANKGPSKKLNDFYGKDMSETPGGGYNREQLRDIYCNRLANRGRSIQEVTKVQTDVGSLYFDLIYATRRTGGDNGYMDVIRYVKNVLEKVHSGDVDKMLDVLEGPQSDLNSYLPEEDIEDELLEDEDENDGQSGLEDFTK